MKVIKKKLIESSVLDNGVLAPVFYTNNSGRLMKYVTQITSSDTFEDSVMTISDDNFESIISTKSDKTRWETNEGTMTKYFKEHFLDEKNNRSYMFFNQGLLPDGKPEDGLKNWQIFYSMSEDGGKSTEFYEPIVMEGEEYSEKHPIRDVWIGNNGFMSGDYTCLPIVKDDKKTILLPIQVMPVDENKNLYNPTGAYTYQYSCVLHGEIQDNGKIKWFDISDKKIVKPEESTRGTYEGTISSFSDDRILLICRGSNQTNECIPGYRWRCVSNNGGKTFDGPIPLTYNNGEKFFSPSSCSHLLKHSNGITYWIGNICPENPEANMPRNPLCICEVDDESLLLKKETKFDIAKKEKTDDDWVTFSNFYVREERQSGDILIYMTKMWNDRKKPLKTKGAIEYRLKV